MQLACLSIYLSIYLSVCLYLTICLSVYLYTQLLVYQHASRKAARYVSIRS